MILDAQNEFSNSQAVTATAISTNVIDTGTDQNPVKDLGALEPIFLVVQVDTTFAAAGAATLAVSLESSAAAGLTSANVHFNTGALALAALTAGTTLAVVALPSGDYLRYLGVRYTVGTGPMTAGAVSAFLTRDPQLYRAYAAAVGH
ncbi:hypothetical protein A9K58_00430 [Stenotrophomonas maltophilia]|uniref:Uncharacterized protein n=1 Tax=Stenotrophomonas maltophilia TaxID=40324 RepID=A0A1A6Y3M0_STEMA|nr:hypothetical protein [Stenotrophomonas maltophilia]OBU70452.1 hypothetical protein A9K58_00430 [Stenotrophomonas maltophilia]